MFKIAMLLMSIISLASCNEWVKPNNEGVMMEDYGKSGKSDFHKASGKVATWTWGTELFQVPLYEQKGDYGTQLTISSTDNTDFYVNPVYTYRMKAGEGVNVVFNYKHLGNGVDLDMIEDQILDPRIKDISREISNSLSDEQLMNNGGKLRYEKACTDSLRKIFDKAGFELLTYSSQLSFTQAMKEKIAERNKVEGESAILDKKLANTKKEIELANLNSEASRARSLGVTALLLQEKELAIREIAVKGWVSKGCPMPNYVNKSGFYDMIDIKK